MMTQTHLLIAAAIFAHPQANRRTLAALGGALAPDLAIYILFLFALVTGIPQAMLWQEVYWSEPWQTYNAIGNSVFLYLTLLLSALLMSAGQIKAQTARLWQIFALAALIHLAADFPLHHDDAHQHLWPLSQWRFFAPISYWDPAYYGRWVGSFEIALSLGLIFLLIRRFRGARRDKTNTL